jgi:hypothetical protein
VRGFGVSILLLCSAAPAFGWGCSGHQVVALVALKQLTPNARAKVQQLLQGQPSPSIHRFCGITGLDPFADLATWADDERDVRSETAPWHFIDIPLGASRADLASACDTTTGCVTTAIQQQLDVLRTASANVQDQANALMFLVHFVGDLHQPLHTTTNRYAIGTSIEDRTSGKPTTREPMHR